MAQFSESQWESIFNTLDGPLTKGGATYGLPKRRRRSLVLSSFNIRKFGRLMKGSALKRSAGSWKLLIRYIESCDFVAIQEVMDDYSSLIYLMGQLGPKYHVIMSDMAGGVPGQRGGTRERMAFVYRSDRIKLSSVASDIGFERSAIFDKMYDKRAAFIKAFNDRETELIEFDAKVAAWLAKKAAGDTGLGKRPKRPTFVLPEFVQFIRTPHMAAFETVGQSNAPPYRFMAVNAHLLYGNESNQRDERWREFKALISWIIERAVEIDRVFMPNIILFGDLNLKFKNNDRRRLRIEQFLKSRNTKILGKSKINFPFLDIHPNQDRVYETNARANQTYDHIAIVANDRRLPSPAENDKASKMRVNGFDYGMFDFRRLFFDAVPVAADRGDGKPDYGLFEHDVSDHMPIWIRLPRPHQGQTEFVWE